MTVGDLCDDLTRYIQSHPKQYKDQYNAIYRVRRVKEAFGDRLAKSIRPFEIADWLDSLNRAPATLNHFKVAWSSIYRYGKELDKVDVNPAREVRLKRVNNGVIRFLTPAEEKRIRAVLQHPIDACGPNNEQRKRRLLHRVYELDIALGTGMRRGEQYGLRWRDIDFERRVIILVDTKNGDNRTVPMIDDVIFAFRELKKFATASS
ncbi:MAG: tyrosine-type recombinase/integrase [Acidobacteriaceae bacterium]|nr:tyrosine-type recombinase/integrase [Acidobacteriaceae bacterium]